jgi:hypothetical protein
MPASRAISWPRGTTFSNSTAIANYCALDDLKRLAVDLA